MGAAALAAWIVGGVILGGGFVRVATADAGREVGGAGGTRAHRVLAVGLVVAALVYVAAAALAGSGARVATELAAGAVFVVPAVAGYRGSWAALAVGWLAHGVYDGAVHLAGPGGGPAWYAALCLGFDGLVAGVAARRVFMARGFRKRAVG